MALLTTAVAGTAETTRVGVRAVGALGSVQFIRCLDITYNVARLSTTEAATTTTAAAGTVRALGALDISCCVTVGLDVGIGTHNVTRLTATEAAPATSAATVGALSTLGVSAVVQRWDWMDMGCRHLTHNVTRLSTAEAATTTAATLRTLGALSVSSNTFRRGAYHVAVLAAVVASAGATARTIRAFRALGSAPTRGEGNSQCGLAPHIRSNHCRHHHHGEEGRRGPDMSIFYL